MFDMLIAPIIVGIIAYYLYRLFELFVCKKERLLLIEKIEVLPMNEIRENIGNLQNKLLRRGENLTLAVKRFNTLKIGCLVIGIGLGLALGITLSRILLWDIPVENWNYRIQQLVGAIIISSMLMFGGIGLIVSYIIEKKNADKEKN